MSLIIDNGNYCDQIVASACQCGSLVFLSLSIDQPPLSQPGITVLKSVAGSDVETAVIGLLQEYEGFSPRGVAVESHNRLGEKLENQILAGVFFRPMDLIEKALIYKSRLESTPQWAL